MRHSTISVGWAYFSEEAKQASKLGSLGENERM